MFNKYDKYYYTIEDLMKLLGVSTKLFSAETLANIVSSNFSDKVGDGYYKDGLHANNIWQNIVFKYKTNFILKTNKELTSADKDEIWKGFEKIISRLQETYPKYELLLTKYASVNDFFAPIKNVLSVSGTNKFNDTPQIAEGQDADSYTTNITKTDSETTSENDVNSIMARINEVDMSYKNLVHEWAESFFDLFIESLNVTLED